MPGHASGVKVHSLLLCTHKHWTQMRRGWLAGKFVIGCGNEKMFGGGAAWKELKWKRAPLFLCRLLLLQQMVQRDLLVARGINGNIVPRGGYWWGSERESRGGGSSSFLYFMVEGV